MSHDKLFYIGVKALIENSNSEILIMHAGLAPWRAIKEPYWDLPGGRIQWGQSAIDALKLEIKEETGLTKIAEPELLTTIISNHDVSFPGETERGLALMIYKVSIPEASEITLSHEHTEYKWASKKAAAELLSHKYPPEFTETLGKNVVRRLYL